MKRTLLPVVIALWMFPAAGAYSADVLANLKPGHPRLLLTPESLARLKERVENEPVPKNWYGELRQRADKLLAAPVSQYEIPDGLRLLATSRRVLDRVYTLALVAKLSGDTRYRIRAWDELAAAAAFPDWNPKHFLDTAEMTHAFAIGYDWLYGEWTGEQRETLRKAIVEKGFTPALKVYRADNSWAKARHNWNQVCNGGMGMGALALAEAEPEQAAEILRAVIASLPRAMREFAPDGAWNEGPGYWNYATSYNVVILAALETALGTDFGLGETAGFAETGLFPIYLTGPSGRTFNYADGGDGTIRAPQLFWLAKEFSAPAYAAYQLRHASPSAQDLVWFPQQTPSTTTEPLPLDRYFRACELVSMRSAWSDPKALFVGFKAGDNKANHSHLDLGTFVLEGGGVRWAMDLGADNYNLPGFFGGRRWEYYRLRTEGQNTLVLGAGPAEGQDPRAAGRIVKFSSSPQRCVAVADLTAAYGPAAERVFRGVAMLERQTVLIQDEIVTRTNSGVWWFMHTSADITVSDDGGMAVLRNGSATLKARLLEPKGAKFEVMEASPLPGSPQPEGQHANRGIRKLALHIEEGRNTRVAVWLQPTDSAPTEAPEVLPLESW